MDPVTTIETSSKLVKWSTGIWRWLQHVAKIGPMVVHIDDLRNRVAALEKRLERRPFDECPRCHALEWRIESSEDATMAKGGPILRHMKCSECGYTEHSVAKSDAGN
jgi:hypothetical protein